MLLEVEKKSSRQVTTAEEVREAVMALRSYGESSFASLTRSDGCYLQVAGGGVTCLLERHDAIEKRHFRAHLDTASKVFPDGTVLSFGGGNLKLAADEWLTAAQVAAAFEAFLSGSTLPSWLRWREVTGFNQ